MENMKMKIGISIIPVLLSLLITMAGSYYTNQIAMARMDERIATIKENNARHEMERGHDIQTLLASREDHAQRIIRLETSLDAIHIMLSEMKTDLKTLLKGEKAR